MHLILNFILLSIPIVIISIILIFFFSWLGVKAKDFDDTDF